MRAPIRLDSVLVRLADGRFHSGEDLASELGVSRTAVWKLVQRLQLEYGLELSAVRGRGYRLAAPLELLRHSDITSYLGEPSLSRLQSIDISLSVSSTNTFAASALPLRSGQARAWLAEHQTAGRGRRGRSWLSGFGTGVALSVAWRFDLPMSQLASLSLVAGVAVAEALQDLGIRGHGLKWPNDLIANGRKLAGILVEVSGEAGGPATAVIGAGINVAISAGVAKAIDQPWIDLSTLAASDVSRNAVAGIILDRLVNACAAYANEGLEPFLSRWVAFDRLVGEPVSLIGGDRVVNGTYAGIAADGALILQTDAGTRHFHAGEVSLRRQKSA